MSEQKHSNNHDEIEILESGWTKFPAFWIRDLMPLANGISTSFGKYLIVIWNDIVGQRTGFTSYKTMDQCHVTRKAAIKWTAALWASCLFDVRYGKKHNSKLPGTPTKIEYRTKSSEQDWICFINALREALLNDKDENFEDTEGFRIEITFRLREERQRSGLPAQEVQERIQKWIADATITTGEDGKCTWRRRA